MTNDVRPHDTVIYQHRWGEVVRIDRNGNVCIVLWSDRLGRFARKGRTVRHEDLRVLLPLRDAENPTLLLLPKEQP